MVETYYVKVNNSLERNIFEKLQNFISDERRSRIQKFKFYEDAILSLFSELIVRMILTQTRKIENSEIHFSNNLYGKPNLRDESLNFHFNISHTKGIVFCSVDDNPVGVDVEYKKPIEMSIAKRFFTMQEYNRLKKLKDEEQKNLFYDLWVIKESYLKYTGEGLRGRLDSFNINFKKREIQSYVDGKECKFIHYNIEDKYFIAVCSRKNKIENKPIEVSLQEIISFFRNV